MINNDEMTHLSIEVGQALLERKKTLTTAESCTGGWIAKVITDIAGSSDYYHRGFVTYSNQAKHDMIGVDEQTLSDFGAVSEQVVCEMAKGGTANSKMQTMLYRLVVLQVPAAVVKREACWFSLVWLCNKTPEGLRVVAKHCIFSGSREGGESPICDFSL